ncbi:hypothetical protein XENORESO_013527 [Xenotaenia resolanae]|uniref:Uncharacterized protein n=1 Tax=Xenotaenia resolanae TaxID=208358 RepID=A0ABV0W2S1_9TELE
MWTHSPGNSHPKFNNPPSCHSQSPLRTWNTNLPQRRNHFPPGYPLPPPPKLTSLPRACKNDKYILLFILTHSPVDYSNNVFLFPYRTNLLPTFVNKLHLNF